MCRPIEHINGDEEEGSITRFGDADKQTNEVEKVVTTEPDSQTKKGDDSEPEYKEVPLSELLETNVDAVPTSKEVKPEESTDVSELDATTTISDQEPTSTVDVVESKEQEEECNIDEIIRAFLMNKVDNDFEEVVSETVVPTDMVESSIPEPGVAASEVEDLKIKTSEEPITSELEALIESVSISEPKSQVDVEASSEIELEVIMGCDVLVTETVGTALEETDPREYVKYETEQKDEPFSVPKLQTEEEETSDEWIKGEESMETNEVFLQAQSGAANEAGVVSVAVYGQEAEIISKIREFLKPKEIEETQVTGKLETQTTKEYSQAIECHQCGVDELGDLIAAETNFEISNDVERVSVEAAAEKVEKSQSKLPKEAIELPKEIQSVDYIPGEVIPNEEINESTNEPVEQMTTTESLNVTDQEIPKGDEKVVGGQVQNAEGEKEDIESSEDEERIEESSLGAKVISEEKPSASQEVEASEPKYEEAGEHRQESDTIPEFETMQIDGKLAEVAEVKEQKGASESKLGEAGEIQHKFELKSGEEISESETKPSTGSEEVEDEMQHEVVVESETKQSEEMPSESEEQGESESMQVEAAEIRQELENTEVEMSEGFEEAKNQQVKASLNEEKADEIQHEYREQSHEETVVPEAKQVVGVSAESEKENKYKSTQENAGDTHQEFEEISREESVKSGPTENKVEEKVEGQAASFESKQERSIDSETEEMRIWEKTLVETDNGLGHENESREEELQESPELKEPKKAGDVQQKAEITSNAESEEDPTGTEEGTEEEGREQHDEAKPHRKRRRRNGRHRYGKGKH
ncbi:unnamed protein product [Hymenolepis diminuta]|uniref:Titin-like n=1 Tax=Hymenolepis diminuta TaxID=6216 RepID=A0A0R3SGH1_HYMDI|nr:unnamed protein product [Hymenolepis diminuta]